MSTGQRTYQLTVFGATGFTARIILVELVKGNPTRWPQGLKWSLAGRNRSALEKLRSSLFDDTTATRSVPLPDIVVANVHDEESMNNMARQSQLLLNCVGPYRAFGMPVVKACIEAQTDYLDLCGEPGFIERMHLLYHDPARKADVTICHAAAFDSVPCDLGVNLCKKLLAERGAYPSSVEMFISLRTTTQFVVNYATYEAAIKGFSSTKELREGRKELARIRPKPTPIGPALRFHNNGLLSRLGVSRDERVGGWSVPYFFSDPAVVRLSQMLTLHMTGSSGAPPAELAPVHFAGYIQIHTFRAMILFLLNFLVFQFLVVRAWGRDLLYKYPGLFTSGLVRKGEIDTNGLDGTSFTQTFYAKGYSSALHPTPVNVPDVNLTIRIAGPEPGYKATAVIIAEVTSLMLTRRNEVRKGVLTPAVAFGHLDKPRGATAPGEGGVLDALQKDGRVSLSLLSA